MPATLPDFLPCRMNSRFFGSESLSLLPQHWRNAERNHGGERRASHCSTGGEKSGYKNFLDSLSSQIAKVKEAERTANDRAVAIEAKAEFDDDGNPAGSSRPMLSALPDEEENDGEDSDKDDA